MNYLCYGALVLALVIMFRAWRTYSANAHRKDDDPQTQDFHPLAIILIPITLPIFGVLSVFIFIVKSLLYAIFLILFTAILILVPRRSTSQISKESLPRKASIWDKLLTVNTALIKLFWNPRAKRPELKKSPYTLDDLVGRLI